MNDFIAIAAPGKAAKEWYKKRIIAKIQQSEIAFAKDEMRIISTSGAGPCVILILYDRISRQGFMAHLFAATEISPYAAGGKWLIQQCSERYKTGSLNFYLIGGYSLISSCLIYAIEHFIHVLRNELNVQSIYRHLRKNWVSNIVFDFNTAELFYYERKNDTSRKRPFDSCQAIITSFVHLLPHCHLIEHEHATKEADISFKKPRRG